MGRFSRLSLTAACLVGAVGVRTAGAAEEGLDGADLSAAWALPFAGVLLSIALGPILIPHVWHRHYGKIALAWALCAMFAMLVRVGPVTLVDVVAHTLLLEYIPFVLLLLSLFTVTGGLLIEGPFTGRPASNTGLIAVGSLFASLTGTTGAAMLLVRPLIRSIAWRRRKAHTIVFFIFLVANIGGALTPLGDPPLFLGFLQGVPFFWPTTHLFLPTVLCLTVGLLTYFLIDRRLARGDAAAPGPIQPFRLRGAPNLVLLAAVLLVVLASGTWRGGEAFHVGTTHLTWGGILRDLGLVAITVTSWLITPTALREANGYSWAPMTEVAKLFAAIFVTIIPVLAMLRATEEGVFAPLVTLVTLEGGAPNEAAYFWATGILSSFLDNAPTYLVFFNLAGGDVGTLTTLLAPTLTAVSAGAVFMGAMTYIGNAPNFMVRAVAEEAGIRMPSFFAYMGWSIAVLSPLFLLVTVLFFV